MTPFTKTLLDGLKPKETTYRQRDGVNDPELKGFYVSVRPSGSKSFELGYTSPTTGRRGFVTIAPYPGTSLSEARQMCRDARALIRSGIDPKEQREQEEAERVAVLRAKERRGTVEELFDFHVRDLRKREKSEGAISQAEGIYRNHVAKRLGKMPANEVTSKDVLNVLRSVDAPYMRREVYTRLKAAFKFGMIGENTDRWAEGELPLFDLDANPLDRVEPPLLPDSRSQGHVIDQADLPLLWYADEKVHLHVLHAFRLLLLTGLRIEEVLNATWGEFDTDGRTWEIPAKRRKYAFDLVVPLGDLHVETVTALRQVRLSDQYLFPSERNEGPRDHRSFNQSLGRLRERLGVEKFAPRDIRRTFKTLGGKAGLSLEIRDRLQGHSIPGVSSRHYDKYDYLPEKREAISTWEAFLGDLLSKGGDNVVRLHD